MLSTKDLSSDQVELMTLVVSRDSWTLSELARLHGISMDAVQDSISTMPDGWVRISAQEPAVGEIVATFAARTAFGQH
jgi:predicted transcriptional regulator